MSTKEKVLEYFEQHRGKIISGEVLAEAFSVSRTSIWKAVKALQHEGYLIEATTNKGYILSEESDLLSEAAILPLLKEKPEILKVFSSVESTNTTAKALVNENPVEKGIILAEEQTKGRGRLGRSFYSPGKSGIYMSLIYGNNGKTNATYVTTAAAVAVCQVIESLTGKRPVIKWVNDIFLDNRKICGILTEGVVNFETGIIDTVILGIGLNVLLPSQPFPDAIQSVAGTLYEKKQNHLTRNRLAAEIINRFDVIYQQEDTSAHLEDYRKRCFVIGQTVSFEENRKRVYGRAAGIDEEGGLIVDLPNGSAKTLRYGEISIKLIKEDQ